MFALIQKFAFSSAIKTRLLQNSLSYVQKYGWNDRAIHAACASLDLSPASHRLVTPYSLITHSMTQWNNKALQILDDTNFQGRKRIRQKIAYAIKVRLQQEKQYIDTWHEAMKIGAQPENLSTTKDLLWSYSDQVWRRCGDTSTDYNYYSKRILFNSAYASTEIFMLTDQSPGKFATWEFLERRLDNIEQIGKGVSDLKVVGEAIGNGVLSLFSMFKTPKTYEHPIQSAAELNIQKPQSDQKAKQQTPAQ